VISLNDCGQKLSRVEDQLFELRRRRRAFNEIEQPITRHDKPRDGQIIFRFGKVKPVPTNFGIIAGEILHNLRSPLDYLACRMVERAGGRPDGTTAFPICLNKTEFNPEVARKMPGISKRELEYVERVQPYQTTNKREHPLWLLKSLNDIDKHRVLHVCGLATSGGRIVSSYGLGYEYTAGMTRYRGRIREGRAFLRISISDGRPPSEIDATPKMSYDVIFSEKDKVWERLSVIKGLYAIRSFLHTDIFVSPGLLDGFTWEYSPRMPLEEAHIDDLLSYFSEEWPE